MEKILTISIAAYNAEKTLEKCIKSMLNCKLFDKLEIIIVNDGSKDQTLTEAKELYKLAPQSIIIIDKENGGHGSTINAAIKKATGKYFKTVDADDWVESQNMDDFIRSLESTDADLVLNPYNLVKLNKNLEKELILFDKRLIKNKLLRFNEVAKYITIAMHSMTIKTNILRNTKLKIDENCFYVDMEYTLFPLPFVKSCLLLDKPIYDYLIGTSGQSMNYDVFIKRRAQHQRVLLRLFEFYNSLLDTDENIKYLIRERIRAATYIHYRILLTLNPKKTKKEYINFDKNVPHDIYTVISGKTKYLINLIRKTKYTLFSPIVFVLQRVGVIRRDESIL